MATSTARTTSPERIDERKFIDPNVTATGQKRAHVALRELETVWINTGTLCNLACRNCYIESSPKNDRLVYIDAGELQEYLDEIEECRFPVSEIGFTGGEPFMNPHMIEMMRLALARGSRVLVLTNAMRPMMKRAGDLLDLLDRFGENLIVRVSVDHYAQAVHEAERGGHSWTPAIEGLSWLSRHGFNLRAAGRMLSGESEVELRDGYQRLFTSLGVPIDARDPHSLVIFPEMDESSDVPEITESCWSLLNVDPNSMMCANSRMIVKRKGADKPSVVPCTLLPYDHQFELGQTLGQSAGDVALNHPHCARFCVLGGGSCSGTETDRA